MSGITVDELTTVLRVELDSKFKAVFDQHAALTKKATSGVTLQSKAMKTAMGVTGRLTDYIKGLGLASGVTSAAMAGWGLVAGAAAQKMQNLSFTTGLKTEEIQSIGQAYEQLGSSMDTFAGDAERFYTASGGLKLDLDRIREITKEISGMTEAEALNYLRAFNFSNDSARIFKKHADELLRLSENSKKTIPSSEQLEKLADAKSAWSEMTSTISNMSTQMSSTIAPGLGRGFGAISGMLKANKEEFDWWAKGASLLVDKLVAKMTGLESQLDRDIHAAREKNDEFDMGKEAYTVHKSVLKTPEMKAAIAEEMRKIGSDMTAAYANATEKEKAIFRRNDLTSVEAAQRIAVMRAVENNRGRKLQTDAPAADAAGPSIAELEEEAKKIYLRKRREITKEQGPAAYFNEKELRRESMEEARFSLGGAAPDMAGELRNSSLYSETDITDIMSGARTRNQVEESMMERAREIADSMKRLKEVETMLTPRKGFWGQDVIPNSITRATLEREKEFLLPKVNYPSVANQGGASSGGTTFITNNYYPIASPTPNAGILDQSGGQAFSGASER